MLFHESYKCFSSIGGLLSPPKKSDLSSRVVIDNVVSKTLLIDRSVEERNCTDVAKITRKRPKPDKHRHENGKECTRAEDLIVESDPLHHEFAGGVITIPPRIVREHEDYISRMLLFCGNSSSWSPENFHTLIESLPTSTTLIEDSDSNREEINIFSGPDDSIPPGIESDFDSEEDVIDNLLNDDPIPEYEQLTFDMEPDVHVINNVNEDECFDPSGDEINVEVDNSFTFVTRTFLPYLTYPEVSPLLSSTENEDTIFDPRTSAT
ncbi:hypothetical protein Tco_0328062 [Tanacetum coccineum]